MRRILGLIFITLLLLSACEQKPHEKREKKESSLQKKQTVNETDETTEIEIPWEIDMEDAFERAKLEHKNVIVMAVSEGCRWCVKLKKTTLSDPKVLKKLQEYVLVQADRETPEERDILPEFKHVPILFFATPEKEFYDELRGYYSPEELLYFINEIED